jgi:hypothetical protein
MSNTGEPLSQVNDRAEESTPVEFEPVCALHQQLVPTGASSVRYCDASNGFAFVM